jgi:small subunit ribosomal protein S16
VARGADPELRLAMDRVDYWTGVGAQVSPRVAQLVKSFQSRQAGGQAAA